MNIDYLKSKIPGAESGIEIKHSLCAICSPAFYCGMDVFVKDGKVLKVEGCDAHPDSKGKLCTKGLSNREYMYRNDRFIYPMKRVGERGEGRFERISWEEAIETIAQKLNGIKREYGADRVAFYSGYQKWYRSMLARLCHSFGSQSYGTESSSCNTSAVMAWQCMTGLEMAHNFAETDLFIGWATNGYYSRPKMAVGIENAKKRGMKYIIVDPRITPATLRLADLHLRPHLGTDGALALSIAYVLIDNGWIDEEFIKEQVHGFEEYKEYVMTFPPERGSQLTGVPVEDIYKAAQMIHQSSSMSIAESAAPLGHHFNGMNNYRALMSLLVITGNIDKFGGQKPNVQSMGERTAGFLTHEEEFMYETFPKDARKAVGAERFPLWYELRHDMQANDLADNILAQDDNSIKALVGFGMNYRMFADDNRYLEAFKKLDFFVDIDIFMTDTAKWADIILPVCTSMERSEFKCYSGCHLWYTKPAVQPLGESRRDVDIITDLANRLDMDDDLLKSGYENCIMNTLRDLPVTFEDLYSSDLPYKIEGVNVRGHGEYLKNGWPTTTGKIELKCELIAQHPEWNLDALPTYTEPPCPDKEKYPFFLCAGVRIPNAIHSRLHDSPWERSLLTDPSVEMSPADAEKLGVELGDEVKISTELGSLTFKAIITETVMNGELYIYHGYRERDANSILSGANLDPYTGFPAYRSAFCNVEKVNK